MNNKIKHINFIRFGSLNLIKQKGYNIDNLDPDFHDPPARYGVYAFPEYSIESFLLGGLEKEHDRIYKLDFNEEPFVYDDNDYQNHLLPKYKKMAKKAINKLNTNLKYVRNVFIDRDCDGECDTCNLNCDEIKERYNSFALKRPKRFTYEKDLWHHLYEYIDKKYIKKEYNDWVLTSYKIWLDAYIKTIHQERKEYYKKGIKCSKDHHEVFIPHKI